MARLFQRAGLPHQRLSEMRRSKDVRFTTMLRLCAGAGLSISEYALELSREYLLSLPLGNEEHPKPRMEKAELARLKAYASLPVRAPTAKRETVISASRRRRKGA